MKQNLSSGIKERLLKGFGAQGFSQAVQIFIRLAEVPLLLSYWGKQLYGEWLMLIAITAFIGIGDGGFSSAACREMTIKSGAQDKSGVQAVFQSTWFLLLFISILTGLSLLLLIKLLPLHNWFGFSAMTIFESEVVLLLLIASVLVSFQGELLNGGYWVTGRYPRGMLHIAFTQLLEFIGLVIAVILGKGPIWAAIGYLAGRCLGTGIMWAEHHRTIPWLKPGMTMASFTVSKKLFTPAIASLSIPLGNALNIHGIRLILGLVLGPAAVAVFSPMRTLSRIAMQPRAIISRLIQPELALAHGRKDDSLFRLIFNRSCQIALWACLLVSLLIGLGAGWIFPIWTGGLITLQWSTYILLICGVIINSIWFTALMVPFSINRHGRIALFYILFYGVTALSLSYLWANALGLFGIALSLFFAEISTGYVVIYMTLPMAKMGFVKWAGAVIRPPLNLMEEAGLKHQK